MQTEYGAPLPRATYRLQLNKEFTFSDVERIAPYLGRLGVSHVYLSPILKARAGSTHGYDTVDHEQINPELGTLEEFRQMAGTLRAQGLGIILDIVPNHMGVGGSENPDWLDLLEWGRDSRYADWFDVNWTSKEPSLKGKVLAPFLGSSFAEALEAGRLALKYDEAEGSFAAWAEDSHKLPIDPRSYGLILKSGSLRAIGEKFEALRDLACADALKAQLRQTDPAAIGEAVEQLNTADGSERLRELYEQQNWRAARYSVASDDINYRRFFIVSDLGAIRVERQEVFDHAHRLIFQLVEEGLIDGLRVDHIDGLYDPKQYALRLREKCPRPIYLVVEKILAPEEQLRSDWRVDGTTGYEFANVAIRLLIDPAAEDALTNLYTEFTDRSEQLTVIERDAKLEMVDYEMAAELDSLTDRLFDIASSAPAPQDLTRNGIRNGLRHLAASMTVYRTYVDAGQLVEEDQKRLAGAIADAKKMAQTLDPAIFAFLEAVASGQLGEDIHYDRAKVLETAMRLQQFTGPVMAKGLEDTTLYRYNRFIAVNDVGNRPDEFALSVKDFHRFNSLRVENTPNSMLSSSSHDTKRGEDVRARLAALSLNPDDWASTAHGWAPLLDASDIERNDLFYLLQQLVGSWPAEFLGRSKIAGEALKVFEDRILAAMTKALREARRRTNWTAPNEQYESAIARVIRTALDVNGHFFQSFQPFAEEIAKLGARNGLVATVLKLTAPGMPDIYQGAELHELSMVDPDNRRPVDFDLRSKFLHEQMDRPVDVALGWQTGASKLNAIAKLLNLRKKNPQLFAFGSYEPMDIEGDNSGRSLAFLRRHEGASLVVVAWLGHTDQVPTGRLGLPGVWTSVLTGETGLDGSDFQAALGDLPVAVLYRGAE